MGEGLDEAEHCVVPARLFEGVACYGASGHVPVGGCGHGRYEKLVGCDSPVAHAVRSRRLPHPQTLGREHQCQFRWRVQLLPGIPNMVEHCVTAQVETLGNHLYVIALGQ